jgi:hypothetical protein
VQQFMTIMVSFGVGRVLRGPRNERGRPPPDGLSDSRFRYPAI